MPGRVSGLDSRSSRDWEDDDDHVLYTNVVPGGGVRLWRWSPVKVVQVDD